MKLILAVFFSLILISSSVTPFVFADSQNVVTQNTGQTTPLYKANNSTGTTVWDVDPMGNMTIYRNGFPTTELQVGSLAGTPNYLVYNYGSNIYVRDGYTGKIVNYGTNATTMIQYAIDQTPYTGGSVFVKNSGSVYSITEQIQIKKQDFKFLSDGATLRLDKAVTQLIHLGDGSTQYNYNEISGFTLNANSLASFGIRLHGDSSSVQWTIISRNVVGNATLNDVSVESATYTAVFGNHFKAGATGLYFESVSRATAIGNTFSGQTARSIHIDSSGIVVDSNVIGGLGKSGAANGINLFNAGRSVISNNFIKDVSIGISLGANAGHNAYNSVTIDGNTIWNVATGIQQQRYYNAIKITGNSIENATNGISISTFGAANNNNHVVTSNTIIGDKFYGGSGTGVLINSGKNMTYTNNNIQNFTTFESFTGNPTFMARWTNATFSGTGSQQDFTVTHRLGGIPAFIFITPQSDNATGNYYVSSTGATTFTVHYKVAPPSGTKNVKFYWWGSVRGN